MRSAQRWSISQLRHTSFFASSRLKWKLKKELPLLCRKENWVLCVTGPLTVYSYFHRNFWEPKVLKVIIKPLIWSFVLIQPREIPKSLYGLKCGHEPTVLMEFRDQSSPELSKKKKKKKEADQAFRISQSHFPYQREGSYAEYIKSCLW